MIAPFALKHPRTARTSAQLPHRMQAQDTDTTPSRTAEKHQPRPFAKPSGTRCRKIRTGCRTNHRATTPPGKGTESGRHDTADMAHADRDLQQEPHPNTETSVQSAVLPSRSGTEIWILCRSNTISPEICPPDPRSAPYKETHTRNLPASHQHPAPRTARTKNEAARSLVHAVMTRRR